MALSDEVMSLKADLTRLIQERVAKFSDATGLTPRSIDVQTLDVTHFGGKVRQSSVFTVHINLGRY